MPELDYALLGDYVRSDASGVAHVIAAGVDTVYTSGVPTGRNLGLLMRLTFSRNETGRPHRVEVIFQDADGQRLAVGQGILVPEWTEGLPAGWRAGALFALNLGLPMPRYGEYSLEVMVDDRELKTIPLRVVEMPTEGADDEEP
jgi:hypothetical protein